MLVSCVSPDVEASSGSNGILVCANNECVFTLTESNDTAHALKCMKTCNQIKINALIKPD